MTLEIVKGQPFKLPDGTIVLPEPDKDTGSTVTSEAEIEAAHELEEALSAPTDNEYGELYQRTLADVNVEPRRMNTTMLVVTYTLWGLDSFAIAHMLGTEPHLVDAVKSSDLFDELKKQMVEAIRYAETATVHGYIAANAHKAARVVAGLLANPSADMKLAAAKDILDRSGFRPVDRVEHSVKFEDELRIKYITEEKDIPTIDLAIEHG